MKTEFFVRMYFGGAAHRWQRDFGKGNGVGGTDSFGSLIDSDGTASIAADSYLPAGAKTIRTAAARRWSGAGCGLAALQSRCGYRRKGTLMRATGSLVPRLSAACLGATATGATSWRRRLAWAAKTE